MSNLRTAVIGVGYLGNFHAQKYAAIPGSKLVGVVDTDPDRAAQVAASCSCQAFRDYRDLIGQVDAVSVVVPTRFHHQVAREFLANNVHVLIEKPITTTIEQADELITLADDRGLVIYEFIFAGKRFGFTDSPRASVRPNDQFNRTYVGVRIILRIPRREAGIKTRRA